MENKIIDIGNHVVCDICNKDWTGSDVSGGFTFGSKAVCPDCHERILENIKKFDEEEYIGQYCPKDMSYYRWVLDVLCNGEPRVIEIINLDKDL